MPNTNYRIRGNDRIPDFNSELDIDVDDRYEAYSKTIPDPTPYQDGVITWFNAFGVREKASRKDEDVTYRVTMQAPPAGKRLFALYGGEPHEIETQPLGNGRVRFTLNVGDPPTGLFP